MPGGGERTCVLGLVLAAVAGCGGTRPLAATLGAPPHAVTIGTFVQAAPAGGAALPEDAWAARAAPAALANALAGAPGVLVTTAASAPATPAAGPAAPPARAPVRVDGAVRHAGDLWVLDVRLSVARPDVAPTSVAAVGTTLREAAIAGAHALRRALGLAEAEWPDAAASALGGLADALDRADTRREDAAVRAEAELAAGRWPERAEPFVLRARVRRLAGDTIGAREDVDAALLRDPRCARARLELARILLDVELPLDAQARLSMLSAGPGEVYAARVQAEAALLARAAVQLLTLDGHIVIADHLEHWDELPPADRLAVARAAFWQALDIAGAAGELSAAPPARAPCPPASTELTRGADTLDAALAAWFARACALAGAGEPELLDPARLMALSPPIA
ncbi:MAG TPA: hypothetical protein VG389_18115, partial [Myxococcota bacterium]|nr:hypothetical protein [Myxococcota bacterium]